MKWIQYKISTTTDAVEPIGEILYRTGIQGFEVQDNVPPTPEEERQMYTDIPAPPAPDDGRAVILFYTEGENTGEEGTFYSTGSSLRDQEMALPGTATAVQPEELIAALREHIREMRRHFSFPEPEISYSSHDDSEWKEKWKENFQPFRASDHLIVKPVWSDIPEFTRDGDILLQIDPGPAFGTGTHETTRLCMASLEKVLHRGDTILDVGCGSGILAIAALLLGAGSALCLDIDPCAVRASHENAARNQISHDHILIIQGNILEDDETIRDLAPEPFDIALANILADIIIPLSSMIGPFLKPGGILICSGILTEKAAAVRQALLRNRFIILEEDTQGEWISFTAQKSCDLN